MQTGNLIYRLCLFLLFIYLPHSSYALDINNEMNLLLEKSRGFNGVVLIAKDDKLIFSKAKGFADMATRESLRLDSQFIIGSVSKQFTAALVLKAVEEGKLQLEAPIINYLPEYKEKWAKEVTIHHLLTHSSGAKEAGKPLEFKPGSKFEYSNFGYDLLGKILEKVESKRYNTLVKQMSLSCDMTNTFAPKAATLSEIRQEHTKLAIGYDKFKDGSLEEEKDARNFFKNPSRGIISNARDLVNWNKCIWQGHYLKPASIKLMTKPYFKKVSSRWKHIAYGYGIQISGKDALYELSHNGFTKGYVTTLLYYPNLKLSLVVMENVAPKNTHVKKGILYGVHDRIRALLRNYIIDELTDSKKPITTSQK